LIVPLRLMEESKRSLLEDDAQDLESDQTDVSKIYRIIKEMAASQRDGTPTATRRSARTLGKGPDRERDMDVDEGDDEERREELSMVDIRARVLAKNFTETQLMETILQYEELDVWMRVANNSKLRFIT